MKLLGLLEERVLELLGEVKELREKNTALQEELSLCRLMIEENEAQITELTATQVVLEETKERVDALLQEIENVIPK